MHTSLQNCGIATSIDLQIGQCVRGVHVCALQSFSFNNIMACPSVAPCTLLQEVTLELSIRAEVDHIIIIELPEKNAYECAFTIIYDTLDHIPSSCIMVMVHVVKGRQYSAYTVPHAGASIAEMESETDSRPRLRYFNQLDSAVQLLNYRSVVAWHMYSDVSWLHA
jgi:hypothetical protein